MSRNDGTGDFWDESAPADGDFISAGALEIRDDRIGVEIRLKKEHVQPADDVVGGEHLPGSAKAYTGTSDPTLRPDTSTSLDSDDAGREFINTSTGSLRYFDGSDWQFVKIADSSQIPAGFITGSMIAAQTIVTGNIGLGQVITADLADQAVTTPKLGLAQVTTATLADGNVTSSKIAAGAIGLTQLASGILTKTKIGTYTGNGSASPGNSITGLGFKPDFIVIMWPANNIVLVANGAGANPGRLASTDQGQTTSFFNATVNFDSDGFTILTSHVDANQSGQSYLYFALKCNS